MSTELPPSHTILENLFVTEVMKEIGDETSRQEERLFSYWVLSYVDFGGCQQVLLNEYHSRKLISAQVLPDVFCNVYY